MLPWRWHRTRVLLTTAIAWLAGGFVFTVLLGVVVPMAEGLHTYTVRSGSMEPAIDTGDVVVTSTITPSEAEVGDIVTFKDPQGSDDLITHRVRAVRPDGNRLSFVTRGDANNQAERWSVPAEGSIGEVVLRVPKLGHATGPVGTGPGRILLIAIPALLLCALGLVRIWAPEKVGARSAALTGGG